MLFSLFQLFWEKRLQGLSASDVSEQIIKSMELPKGLQGIVFTYFTCFGSTKSFVLKKDRGFDALNKFSVYGQIK